MRWLLPRYRPLRAACVAALACALLPLHGLAAPAPERRAPPHLISFDNKPWTGDFDQMLERRIIRVLVPYSRSLFYIDRGQERGLTAELVRDFEAYLNRKYAKKLRRRPVTVYIVPLTRELLLQFVAHGLGDIAAGNLTLTDQRLELVDFVTPGERDSVAEVVLTRGGATVASAEDLEGHTVHVRKSSSYYESLEELNQRLRKARKDPVTIVPVPDELEDEDLMEMLNAGVVHVIVVDDWKARMWSQVLPNVQVNEDARLREGKVGWAIRKNSPRLQAELAAFQKNFVKRQGTIEYRLQREMARVKRMQNNVASAEIGKFELMIDLFRKYGELYGFDPLMLAAQGYQESRLNQAARSRAGAIGVMQVLPSTGKQMKVGDIKQLEPNIHAGAKYMNMLMTTYFGDAEFADEVRPLFAFASYNAGPRNIERMRREAARRKLDPDKWFNNVELVTADKIGIETTTYVRNIYKYYVSYRLTVSSMQAQEKARGQLAPAGK